MPSILTDVANEMDRQRAMHPVRPNGPYEWSVVLAEETLEALVEIMRLAQEQAGSPSVPTRRLIQEDLRLELIQVAATCAAWAETLPRKEGI